MWCLDGDHGFSLTCLAVLAHSASLSLTCRLASGVRLFGVDLYCCICVLWSPIRMKPPLLEKKQKKTASTSTETTTGAAQTQTTGAAPPTRTQTTQAPVHVRMTRSAVAALRGATTSDAEAKRKRIVRALAQLL